MATWTGCLCLILTLSMAGSARPAITRTVASNPRGGTKEADDIKHLADAYRAARYFSVLKAVKIRGYQISLHRHDPLAATAFLTALGAARLLQYHYRPALDALLEAQDLAKRSNDPAALAAIALN